MFAKPLETLSCMWSSACCQVRVVRQSLSRRDVAGSLAATIWLCFCKSCKLTQVQTIAPNSFIKCIAYWDH